MANEANKEYEIEDPLEDLLLKLYDLTGNPLDFEATGDIRDTLNLHGWRLHSPRAEAMALASMLKKLEVEKSPTRPPRGYIGLQRKV